MLVRLAENIASLRKKRQITQKQLADMLDISPQAVSKWEKNDSQPTVSMLPRLADYFGVSMDYLFYAKAGESPSDFVKNTVGIPDAENFPDNGFGEILDVMADPDCLAVIGVILHMSGIRLRELDEQLSIGADRLKAALDKLEENHCVVTLPSGSFSPGTVCRISKNSHAGICLMLAAAELYRGKCAAD